MTLFGSFRKDPSKSSNYLKKIPISSFGSTQCIIIMIKVILESLKVVTDPTDDIPSGIICKEKKKIKQLKMQLTIWKKWQDFKKCS